MSHPPPIFLVLAAVLLMVPGVIPAMAQNAPTAGHLGPAYLYPDPALTPGVTNPEVTPATIASTICTHGWTASIRPPVHYTDNLKREQITAYGFGDTTAAHYEEDHFIPLELGGHPTDPRNLWPEMWGEPGYPRTAHDHFPPGVLGAKAKDYVETHLRIQVCDHGTPLREAQQAIVSDWYAVYRQLTGH